MNALEGIRVIDFSTGLAGPNCTKLLADFGADVIKIEPLGGDEARHLPPFAGDIPHPERSLIFLHLNTNKRSITIDPETDEGRELLERLIAEAHVVVESDEPGAMAELGLDYEDLAADHPGLVYVSITPWGQDGPFTDMELRASELTLQAMGGPMKSTGSPDREPLKLGGYEAQQQAGTVAAFGIVSAIYRVEGGGEGDYIDVSIYETQAGTRDRRTIGLTAYFYQGLPAKRTGGGFALVSGVQPAADGHFNMTAFGPGRMNGFVEMIGRDDLVGDPRLEQPPATLDPAFVEEVQTAYTVWSTQHSKHEIVAEAQKRRLLSGTINTTEDLIKDAHYRERGVWEEIEHPEAGSFEYPGRPFVMSETPRAYARRAPLLGEHNVEVLTELLGVPAGELPQLRALGVI